MNRVLRSIPLTLAALWLATGCTNPTVDPNSSFSASGRGLDANGMPLTGAQVKLIRYYDRAKLLEPSVDDLFACNGDCSYNDVGLEIAVVQSGLTDMSGNFRFDFKGSDIAARNGVTDSQGKVEGSNLVLVMLDPADGDKRSGVFTFDFLFQQADKSWGAGDFKLWNAAGQVDFGSVTTSGLVKLSWNKLVRPMGSTVNNFYRLELGGDMSAHLVIQCKEGVDKTAGGCDSMGSSLSTVISAYSLYTFYSDSGVFKAWVRGDGTDFRFQSRLSVPMGFPDPRPSRNPLPIAVWAVAEGGMSAPQNLSTSAALDGNVRTQEAITNDANAIYVQIPIGAVVSDAGLLNALVKNAYSSCVIVETNAMALNDVTAAVSTLSGWQQQGKFCGSQGADNTLSALFQYDTSTSGGLVAPWLRFRLDSSTFTKVGEVGVYTKHM